MFDGLADHLAHQVPGNALSTLFGRDDHVADRTDTALFPLIEIGKTHHFALTLDHRRVGALGNGVLQLLGGQRPGGLGKEKIQFIFMAGKATDTGNVLLRHRA